MKKKLALLATTILFGIASTSAFAGLQWNPTQKGTPSAKNTAPACCGSMKSCDMKKACDMKAATGKDSCCLTTSKMKSASNEHGFSVEKNMQCRSGCGSAKADHSHCKS